MKTMGQQNWRTVTTLVAAAAAVGLAGCVGGGGSAAGGPINVGGAPDSACNPATLKQGCTTVAGKPTRVECQAAGDLGKWVKIGECATGEYCAEEAIAGETVGTKKNAVCKAIPSGGGGGVDATGGGDGTGGGGGVTDGGPAKTPAEEFSCIEQKCAGEVQACMANPKCAQMMACAKACTTEECTEKCAEPLMSDETILGLALAMGVCGEKAGCVASCGNGKCEGGEHQGNCAEDCKPAGPVCGNSTCEAGESNASCPADCKTGGAVCGNGVCDSGETNASCPTDCKTGGAVCGNATCDSGETAKTCAVDCDPKAKEMIACAKSKCGDAYATCFADEKCAGLVSCYLGCGDDEGCLSGCLTAAGGAALSKGQALLGCTGTNCSNPVTPSCGNGTCEEGETPTSCASDCKSTSPVCGNEKCESGENYATCPTDCPCTMDSQCGSGKKCSDGQCVTSGTSGQCADGICQSGEKCLADCDNEAKTAMFCAMEACSKDWNACKSDSQCWGMFLCVNACPKNDESCGMSCLSKFPGAGTKGQPLATCTEKFCSGSSGPVCGDGTCDSGETTTSCPTDCKPAGCTSDVQCPAGQKCQAGKCVTSGGGGCTQSCPAESPCTNGICTKFTTGSCKGVCGQQDDAVGCYCDEDCKTKYFDCCPDILQQCSP